MFEKYLKNKDNPVIIFFKSVFKHFIVFSREAEPVEAESPLTEEEKEEPVEEDETQMISQEGESPVTFPGEEGSGSYEGSGAESPYMADIRTAREAGSGESWPETESELFKGSYREQVVMT